MEIKKIKGKHSEDDEIILLTTKKDEPIYLSDVFELVYQFSLNELHRIRFSRVREDIVLGLRPFLFENEVQNAIEKAKKEVYDKILKGGLK